MLALHSCHILHLIPPTLSDLDEIPLREYAFKDTPPKEAEDTKNPPIDSERVEIYPIGECVIVKQLINLQLVSVEIYLSRCEDHPGSQYLGRMPLQCK